MKRTPFLAPLLLSAVAALADDHGDLRSGATPVPPTSTTQGVLEQGDVDYFRIELPTAGALVLSSSGGLDTVGRLEGPDGTRIVTDNNGGDGKNFRIARDLESGTYYLLVRGRRGATGSYAVTAEFASSEADDHGDLRAEATPVATTSSTAGFLGRSGDIDYFRIDVAQIGFLVVASVGDTDTSGRLERGDGTELATDDDGGNGDNFRIARYVETGAHYVAVRGYDDSRTGEYILAVSFVAAEDGDLRLQDGSTSSGRLEILHAGEWGTVCDDDFDNVDATVACRQLGYASGRGGRSRISGKGTIWLDDLACTGEETRLDQCPHAGFGNHNCVHFEDVGVTCSEGAASITISADSTRVSEGHAASFTLTRRGQGTSPSDLLTVAVRVSEDGNSLSSPPPTSVTFEAGSVSASLRLATDDDTTVEADSTITVAVIAGEDYDVGSAAAASVVVADNDRPVADDHGDSRSEATSVATTSSTAGILGSSGDVDYFRIDVGQSGLLVVSSSGDADTSGVLELSDGTELATDDDGGDGRNFRIEHNASTGSHYVAVRGFIGEYTLEVSFTPPKPTVNFEPRPLVLQPDGTWVQDGARITEGEVASYTLTRSGPSSATLTVRIQVSETGGDMLSSPPPTSVTFPAGATKVTLQLATEDDAEDEAYSLVVVRLLGGEGYKLGPFTSSSVVVVDNEDDPEGQEGDLRLADGWATNAGRLEILHDGEWGTVCDDYFDQADADVACRQLGYDSAARYGHWGGRHAPVSEIWLDDLACTGDETRLDQCPHAGFGNHNCVHFEDVVVDCAGEGPEPEPVATFDPPTNVVADRVADTKLRLNWDAPAGVATLVYDVCIEVGTADCTPAAREYARPYQRRGDASWTFHLFGNPRGGTDGLISGTTYRMCVLARRDDEFSPTVCVTSTTTGG